MITLAHDTIDQKDLDSLSEWLKTGPHLTMNKFTLEFEREMAGWLGMKYAVMVNSGSSANLLVLQGLLSYGKLQKGDKVIVPAISWATDLAPVIQLGLEPVLCDANIRNVGVDIVMLEKILKEQNPKAIMLVSVLGMPPDMEDITFLCHKYGCVIIEDFCESLGSKSDGRLLGSFGFASTTSLYFGHHISTIEGGLIFTNDRDFYNILIMVRAHGWDRNLILCDEQKDILREKHGISDFNSRYTFYYPGFNLRPTEINAFLGLLQLDKIELFVKTRRQIFDYYNYTIKNDYWKPAIPECDYVSNLGYPLIHPKRDRIVKSLEGICETRPFISGNMANQPFYKKYKEENGLTIKEDLPIAEMIHRFGMYLPNHPFIKEDELSLICKCVNSVIG